MSKRPEHRTPKLSELPKEIQEKSKQAIRESADTTPAGEQAVTETANPTVEVAVVTNDMIEEDTSINPDYDPTINPTEFDREEDGTPTDVYEKKSDSGVPNSGILKKPNKKN